MAKNEKFHVVPRNDKWVIRKEGSTKATSIHKNQRDAVKVGKEIARNNSSELVIHGRDGRIRERDSYRSDPMPPKDREPREVLFPDTSTSVSRKAIKEAVSAVVKQSKSGSKRKSASEARG
jgi:Uncharacterized protein conserved in bacteria (DUF2188)